MESLPQSHSHVHTPESQNFTSKIDLSPELDALWKFAKKHYHSLESIAKRSDDDQEHFTSKAANYLTASDLTSKIALLVRAQNRG